jgi:hypothetical protein
MIYRHSIPADLLAAPFRLETAQELGISRDILRGNRFCRPYRGVYVARAVPDSLVMRVRAALLAAPPGSWPSHTTGLALWGLEVGSLSTIHLSTDHPHEIELPGVAVHRRLRRPALVVCDGLPLGSPERNWVESCLLLGFVNRVVVADWLLRWHIDRDSLGAFVMATHLGGVKRARRVMAYARERVDSPKETVVRLCLVFAHLPEPEVNIDLSSESRFIARPDLRYPRYRVAVEYDGQYHLKSAAQREYDNMRRENLERLGWIVIVATADRMREPRHVVHRVYAALRERGYAGPAPVFSTMWSSWFESARWAMAA